MFQQMPRFRVAVQDKARRRHKCAGSNEVALAAAGVAVGVAIRQWAREGGHEAIAAAADSGFYPSKELDSFIGTFRESSGLPLGSLRTHPSAPGG